MRNPDDTISVPVSTRGGDSQRERLLKLMLIAERKSRQNIDVIRAQREPGQPAPLSYSQERLWFIEQMGLAGAAYNLVLPLRLAGALDETALQRALNEILRRHELLRSHFSGDEGCTRQFVDEVDDVEIARADFSVVTDPEARELQLHEWLRTQMERRFDLRQGPLLRAALARAAADKHVLAIAIHHIAADGWSLGILEKELRTLYSAYACGQSSPLAKLALQYADYAIWQRQWLQGPTLQQQLSFWREQLLDAPAELQLPTDRPRPAVESFKGAARRFKLSSSLKAALADLAKRNGATLFMVCLSAYQILLWRWSGQRDIVVGSPTAGRHRSELEGLIGFFVNTLPLRTRIAPEMTGRELLASVKQTTLAAFACQDVPFDVLVKELRPDRSLARQPIYQVALALQNYPHEDVQTPGLSWSRAELSWNSSYFDLTLYLQESDDGLTGVFEYATDLFDAPTIDRMLGHFGNLLEHLVAQPDLPVRNLNLLGPLEQRQVLEDWNATAADFPADRCIHELVAEQVRRAPMAVAVACDGEALSYAELDRWSDELAACLIAHGVATDVIVGVLLGRSVAMVVGMLAVLKAGGAYLPLDPALPEQRLNMILEDAGVSVIVSEASARDRLRAIEGLHVIDVDRAETSGSQLPPHRPPVSPDQLAYVIYTSGSTGRPKGVLITHRGVCSLIAWQAKRFGLTADTCSSQFASMMFDAAVWEIWPALATGGRIAICKNPTSLSAAELAQWLADHAVNVAFLPTPVAEQFLASGCEAPAGLRYLLTGGDQLRQAPARPLGYRLVNNYGPTEITVLATSTEVDVGIKTLPPIGSPIANTRAYVLDEALQPTPIGVTGELYIAGAGLARGYLNRAELTADRFIANPFDGSGGRMYRTGDLVRWAPNGALEFLGRGDSQVKIRGYRIELGEIEAALLTHAAVRQAVVLAREDTPGEKRLAAYVAFHEGREATIEELRAHARDILPSYMTPAAFVVLEGLPLTQNGKVDRRMLPAPSLEDRGGSQDPPQGQTEEMLASIWEHLLGVSPIGRRDNFFELGGHSLHGMQLMTRIADQLGVRAPVASMFRYPTVQQMAQFLEAQKPSEPLKAALPEGPASAVGQRAPLAFSQAARWQLLQRNEVPSLLQVAAAMRLAGKLNYAALQRAVVDTMRRHDALRTQIVVHEGAPMQFIGAAGDFALPIADLSLLPQGAREQQLLQRIEQFILIPIKMDSEPLVGWRLFKLEDDVHVLLVGMHHFISDNASLSIVLRDVFDLYEQAVCGRQRALPPVELQFHQFASRQAQLRGEWLSRHGQYWSERLAGAQRLRFPEDEIRPARGQSGWDMVRIDLGLELKERLRDWSRERRTTLAMAVLSMYTALVMRWCDSSDGVMQFQSDGRNAPEIENTVGFFASVLYLRVTVSADATFADLLSHMMNEYYRAADHADESYLAAQSPRPDYARSTTFNWVPQGAERMRSIGVGGDRLDCSTLEFEHPMLGQVHMDQEPGVIFFDTPADLAGGVYFQKDRHSVATMQRFARAFLQFVDAIMRQPDIRLASIPLP